MPKLPPKITVEVFSEREVNLLDWALKTLVDCLDSGVIDVESVKPGELESLRLKIIVAQARQNRRPVDIKPPRK